MTPTGIWLISEFLLSTNVSYSENQNRLKTVVSFGGIYGVSFGIYGSFGI
jgi:hypothetical protein